jgi:hypothetical protein
MEIACKHRYLLLKSYIKLTKDLIMSNLYINNDFLLQTEGFFQPEDVIYIDYRKA